MKKAAVSLFIVTALVCLLAGGAAHAYSTYLTTFLATYPGTSTSVLNTCGLCHLNPAGGGTRNPYGNDFANSSIGNHTFNSALEARDSDGDGYTNITEINARTFPGDATSHPSTSTADTVPPTVTSFSIPSTSTSLTVPITSLAASDNVGVTGYLLTQSSSRPSATSGSWTGTAPSSYTFSSTGAQTLYAFAKDAAGNVSAGVSATVTITITSGSTTGTVTGVVKDIVTGSAISGAVVTDGTHSVKTNSSGSYSLKEPTGSYTLTISRNGYLTTSQRAAVTSGTSGIVNWALTKSYGNQKVPASNMSYVILAWNDLGMHCDQNDYSYFGILPPYNTLHAQIFKRGGEGAQLVRSGITVSYSFPKKTNSTLHTNFWTYAPQYGWKVPANVGITGTKLSGNMQLDAQGLSYEAVGIPVTPYDDDGTWDPYGTAVVTVKDSSGNVLQTLNVVAPVSTEMMCSNCHGTTNPQLNILQAHDAYNGTTLAADQAKGVVHLCAECHADNVLGMPGKPGVENLSLAMHNFHKDKMGLSATSPDCYNCHPGEKTQCLRGIMARAGKSCHDCHGDMSGMANGLLSGRQPWLEEPQCGSCHDAGHAENSNTLYRNSVLKNGPVSDMNGVIYCEACHNGPHAELTTANPADPTVPKKFQGDNYWIWNCRVCHSSVTQGKMHGGASGTTSGGN